MADLHLEKKRLRTEYLQKRRALTVQHWRDASEAIRLRLEQSASYQGCSTLLTYVSAKDNEVDTCAIIDNALHSGRAIVVPVVITGEKELRWAQIGSRSELTVAKFGLLEPNPVHRRYVDVHDDALCLVPGLAFTRDGWRIGYGGGYYDRFLASFQGTSIGLAFEIQMAPLLPIGTHDQQLVCVLTEKGCYPKDTEI
jgi:5-formyltetrahydrofolate cyclo-ligase